MAISYQQYLDAANGNSVSASSAVSSPIAGTFSTSAAGEKVITLTTAASISSGMGLTSATDNASPNASGSSGGGGLSQSDKIALGCGLSIPLAALILAYAAWRYPRAPKRNQYA
jgi:hypothetical protein